MLPGTHELSELQKRHPSKVMKVLNTTSNRPPPRNSVGTNVFEKHLHTITPQQVVCFMTLKVFADTIQADEGSQVLIRFSASSAVESTGRDFPCACCS